MNREQRFKYCGAVFYLALLFLFATSNAFGRFLEAANNNKDSLLLPAVIATIGLFTSEAIGFFFNSLFIFFWNFDYRRPRSWFSPRETGYSLEWEREKYPFQFKEWMKQRYEEETPSDARGARSWECYGGDVFLSFFWQQAPKELVEWVSRRHTAFFLNASEIVSLCSAIVLWVVAGLVCPSLHWTRGNSILLVFATFLVYSWAYNGEGARREARQMIGLWMHSIHDSALRGIAGEMLNKVSIKTGASVAAPSPKTPIVLRHQDLLPETSSQGKRWFYCNDAVDIVLAEFHRPFVSKKHLHEKNTETYLVLSGTLKLDLDGKTVDLNENDAVVVPPRTLHGFEVTSTPVRFLAIKREPGLRDKREAGDQNR